MATQSFLTSGFNNFERYRSLLVGSITFIPASTAVAGYIAGGQNAPNSFTASVEKFLFVNDARSVLGTGMSTGRDYTSGFASTLAGYAGGGGTSGPDSTVDKFAFSNDSRTTLSTGLALPRWVAVGFDSLVAGYLAGGTRNTGGYPNTDNVEKFTFSSDVRSALSVWLSSARGAGAGLSSSTAGYVAGSGVTTIDKFVFSTDARTTISAVLTGTVGGPGFSSATAGYSAAGASQISMDKLSFSNEVISILATGLSINRSLPGAFASGFAGYVAGDFNTFGTSVDKFSFSNDSRSTLAIGLSQGRGSTSGFPNNTSRSL
jgi:hypothetical protein